jgi:hypothetical protein
MKEKLMLLLVVFLWVVPVFAQQPEKMISLQPDSVPYTPAVNYTAGSYPISIFCANLNGDMYLDLAVADYMDSSVTILLNNGNGTFYASGNYPVGTYPWSVFCADLDRDGDLDLAVANNGSYNVSVLMNYGNGTFSSPTNYMVGVNPTSLFCTDLDGDDDIDIAVTNGGSNDVTILRNQGNGIFSDTVYYINVGANPVSIFGADMDWDGDMDLAVANRGSDSISVLMNNGQGYFFQSAVNYAAGDGPRSIFCADLDNDLDMDVAVVNQYSNTVSIFRNVSGNGSLSNIGTYDVGDEPRSIFCTDVDGDGFLDLAVANGNSNNILIMLNFGSANFEYSGFYGVGNLPMSVFAEDLDRDGDFDLAVANYDANTVSILKNRTQIDANQPPSYFSLLSPYGDQYWQDTTSGVVFFDWQNAVDPNLGDQVRYNLYVSTNIEFLPLYTTVYHELFSSHYADVLPYGQYYWKVMAYDNWGATQWSYQFYQFFNNSYIPDTLGTTAYSPVDLIVNDPNNDSIGLSFNTIPGATYDTTRDVNHDGDKDDLVILPDRLVGLYMIRVFPEPVKELKTTYSLGIRIDGGAENSLCQNHSVPGEGEVDTFYYYAPWFLAGDATGDWNVDVGDIVYLINYLYRSGTPPDPLEAGDATCEGVVDVGDVVYLINYLFKNGPPPSC